MTSEREPSALGGLRVLDLSFYAPGRVTSMMLADLGADVVCVEMPRGIRPDESRLDSDQSSRWLFYQRNKRSITLNLKTERGMEVFRRLVAEVDVVIESYKAGTATRLGVDYEAVRAINPNVIYCSVSGFGQTGPYRDYIGHEPNYQGLSGILAHNHLAGNDPTVLPALVGDIGGGALNAVIGIVSALYHRTQTGDGQYIDIAIASGILPLLGSLPYAQWMGEAVRATSFSNGHRPGSRTYRTKDDKYVSISPSEPWLWERFCSVIGRDDLAQYKSSHAEMPELVEILKEVFLTRTRQEWADLNEVENIAITAVLSDIGEVEADPQMAHREVIAEIEYAGMGKVKQIKTPIKMSKTPPTVRWIPRYGQHTDDVYREAGYGDEEIAQLRAEGVCE